MRKYANLKTTADSREKRMPSTEVPYQYLSIEFTLDPPSFSLDTTFKHKQVSKHMLEKRICVNSVICKYIVSRNLVLFPSVFPSEMTFPRKSESGGKGSFFRGKTELVFMNFVGIPSEGNSVEILSWTPFWLFWIRIWIRIHNAEPDPGEWIHKDPDTDAKHWFCYS